MYETYYGLTGDPFRLTPNRRFCFRHRSYRKALAYLRYGVQRGEGFVMVTGRAGTGKTTLINDLLEEFGSSAAFPIVLNSTQVEGGELVRMIAFDLGIRGAEHMDKASLLRQIVRTLDGNHRAGRQSVLMVDEAQGLPMSSLEELRFLTNLEKDGRSLLQVFLAGQEPLADMMRQPQLEQLHQRLVAACHLSPLDVEETRAYVEHRLRCADWRGDPRIDERLYPVIQHVSAGIPRRINQLAGRLLMFGFVEEKRYLGPQEMRGVLEDLRQDQLLPVDLVGDVEEIMLRSAVDGARGEHAPGGAQQDSRPQDRLRAGSRGSCPVRLHDGQERRAISGSAATEGFRDMSAQLSAGCSRQDTDGSLQPLGGGPVAAVARDRRPHGDVAALPAVQTAAEDPQTMRRPVDVQGPRPSPSSRGDSGGTVARRKEGNARRVHSEGAKRPHPPDRSASRGRSMVAYGVLVWGVALAIAVTAALAYVGSQ